MEGIRIAWRNLWRNRTRTLITMASYRVLFCNPDHGGWVGARHGERSETQRHAAVCWGSADTRGKIPPRAVDFSDRRSWRDETVRSLEEQGIALVPRLFGFGLVSNGPKSAGGSFWGINPEKEREVFDLANHMDKGRFVSSNDEGGIVIGRKLAKILNVSIGDELIVVVEAADGSIGAELYSVVGILKSVADGVDRTVVLMNERDYRELFSLYGRQFHEFAANTNGEMPLETISETIKRFVPDHETKTWKELSPTLAEMTEGGE